MFEKLGPIQDLLEAVESAGGRLWLEDGQVRYKAPPEALQPEQLEFLKQHKDLVAQALHWEEHPLMGVAPMIVLDPRPNFPASLRQVAIMRAAQTHPTRSNVWTVAIEGPLDLDVLGRSLKHLVDSRDILRTRLEPVGNDFQQIVGDEGAFSFEIIETPEEDVRARFAHVRNMTSAMSEEPFPPDQPMFRCRLLKFSDTNARLILNAHPAIADVLSLTLIAGRLEALYRLTASDRRPAEPRRVLQLRDYATWEREKLGSEALERHRAYWNLQAEGYALRLPGQEAVIPPPGTFSVQSIDLSWTEETAQAIRETAKARNSGNPLVTAYVLAIGAWSGGRDVLIEYAAHHRPADLATSAGDLSRRLLIRTAFLDNPTLEQFSLRIRRTLVGALKYMTVDGRGAGDVRSRLCMSYRVSPSARPSAVGASGLRFVQIAAEDDERRIDYALGLHFTDNGLALSARCLFAEDVFERQDVERFIALYREMLMLVIGPQQDQRLEDLLSAKAAEPELVL